MAESGDAFQDLVTHARQAHVVVIGGGIAGLVAALECAKVGMAVTVLESAPRFGGTIAQTEIDGMVIDTGATGWQASSAAMTQLISELDLTARVVSPASQSTWIAGLAKGGAAPLPRETVLGIPANPWDAEVRRIIGWSGTWRAYIDRLRPPLTIGVSRNLGELVRSRMGRAVHDRLVAPLSVGRFGIAPDDVDVDVAAPGLNAGLTRTGSLGGAVADLRVDAATTPTIRSLDGGMRFLVDALVRRLEELGAAVQHDATATAVTATGTRGWNVRVQRSGRPAEAGAAADAEEVVDLDAAIVVVAAPETAARDLLQGALGRPLASVAQPTVHREIVTLVVDAPHLGADEPRAAAYPVGGTSAASGVVDQTISWAWRARDDEPGRHVLAVAFDHTRVDPTAASPGEPSDDDAAVRERARAAASELLGVAVAPASVVGSSRTRFVLAPPASARGHAERTASVRDELNPENGLIAVGAWLSGSGLAQVVADAVAQADRVRGATLWGP